LDYDCLVIGAGAVGLACAYELSQSGKKCLLAEKHSSFGNGTSSRNSEVIHAGIYYQPGSLKAELCIDGNQSLKEWCKLKKVPWRETGKLIVAVDDSETEKLHGILERGNQNGARKLEILSQKQIRKIQPGIKAVEAINSPSTGIVDSHLLMKSFHDNLNRENCDVAFLHEVIGIEKIPEGYEVHFLFDGREKFSVKTELIINSAGLYSDKIAEMAGIDIIKEKYELSWSKGRYFKINSSKKHLADTLIYPVPSDYTTGLGIHLTVDLQGELKLGPDSAKYFSTKEDYSVEEDLQEKFFSAGKRYLPDLEFNDINPDYSGLRPRLKFPETGFRDFIIKEESGKGLPGLVNLIGIESPGLTCCIEIARKVKKLLPGFCLNLENKLPL
jgi:L-2-hydroxyglutarate oxidase LhgO